MASVLVVPLVYLMAVAGAATGEIGPAVGQALPAFEAPDQDGTRRAFESLRGPRGLVLVFFRSAAW